MSDFFRFPHTPHLVWLGQGEPRDDKVMTEPEAIAFLGGEIEVEEKVDGANLGISVEPEGEIRLQNRGQYLERPYAGQFAGLNRWLAAREDMLFDALGEGCILFGEWCEARHSLEYDRLTDWLLIFDVYENAAKHFWSVGRRDVLAGKLGLAVVPLIGAGRFTLAALTALVRSEQSRFRDGPLEGLYLRRDEGNALASRGKIIRPEFAQSIGEHWSRRKIERNRVLMKASQA